MEIDKFRRQQHRNFMMTHEKVIVMAIKPKYAKAIYEGKKTWEFRKNPPPLNTWIAIYESAPVSAITGAICFDSMVKGPAYVSYEIASSNKCYAVNKPGISPKELKEYLAGSKDMNVCALHVLEFNRFEASQKISVKPPQNWGTFFVSKEEGSAE